uniref:N-acetyltransferase domain-containing protein n=1 Tax=Panagrolaimus sp. ES5 TaxID=591445 RepID=A0AC34FAP4_9BILA
MASATHGPFIAASQIAGNILDWGKPISQHSPPTTASDSEEDEIRFVIADRHKHYEMIHSMMTQMFSFQEPITRSVGATPEDVTDFFHDLCSASLNSPYSVLAFIGDKCVGMTLNYINTNVKSDESSPGLKFKSDFAEEISNGPYNNLRANRVCSFIEEVERNYGYFIPKCKKLFKLDVIFVHPNFSGRGIGTKLTEKSIQVARENNCDYLMSVASAKGSAHIFHKLGFTCVREVPFLSFHENGQQVFQDLHDGNTSGKLMILKLGSSLGFTCVREVPFLSFHENGHQVFQDLHDGNTSGKLMILKLGSSVSSTNSSFENIA